MDRINTLVPAGTPLQTLPDGYQGFIDRNTSIGQAGTTVMAAWLNGVQETLMDPIQRLAGLTPNILDETQLSLAIAYIAALGLQASAQAPTGWQKIGNLIRQWGYTNFPTGVATITQPLPTTWPNGYLRGLITDTNSGCYPFGVKAGADTSHIVCYAPLYVCTTGSIVATATPNSQWEVWGY